jgi:hypothetical protein
MSVFPALSEPPFLEIISQQSVFPVFFIIHPLSKQPGTLLAQRPSQRTHVFGKIFDAKRKPVMKAHMVKNSSLFSCEMRGGALRQAYRLRDQCFVEHLQRLPENHMKLCKDHCDVCVNAFPFGVYSNGAGRAELLACCRIIVGGLKEFMLGHEFGERLKGLCVPIQPARSLELSKLAILPMEDRPRELREWALERLCKEPVAFAYPRHSTSGGWSPSLLWFGTWKGEGSVYTESTHRRSDRGGGVASSPICMFSRQRRTCTSGIRKAMTGTSGT